MASVGRWRVSSGWRKAHPAPASPLPLCASSAVASLVCVPGRAFPPATTQWPPPAANDTARDTGGQISPDAGTWAAWPVPGRKACQWPWPRAAADRTPLGRARDLLQQPLVEVRLDDVALLVADVIAAALGVLDAQQFALGGADANRKDAQAFLGRALGSFQRAGIMVLAVSEQHQDFVIVALFVGGQGRLDGRASAVPPWGMVFTSSASTL